MRVREGDSIDIEGLSLAVLYTPGHSPDSYSFVLGDRVFTGDTLLIRGTGRTDLSGGDPAAQYDSLFNKLLKLPEDTLVYPAHDYKGETVTTIGEELHCNPRLQSRSVAEYVALMNGLKLANPQLMDVAIPANIHIGLPQEELLARGVGLAAEAVIEFVGHEDIVFVDLRETRERQQHRIIPGSLHVPYRDLAENVRPGGMLHELAQATRRRLVFYCAYGERSAMAVQAAHVAGLTSACHIHGGIDTWKNAKGPLVEAE